MVLDAEAEAELQQCIELANTWGGRSGPSMAAELVGFRREAEARALEVAGLHQQVLQQQGLAVEVAGLRRGREGLQQQLIDQEAEAAAMQVSE